MLRVERCDEEQAADTIICAGGESRGVETGTGETGEGEKDRLQGEGAQSERKFREKGCKQSDEGSRRWVRRQPAWAEEASVHISEKS